ncbi:hypothetical protein HDV00_007543 [Rhizophlyctis rosea]|nr:hypothetical protein HDV00_007543 [Rhizophlyctis rosea]
MRTLSRSTRKSTMTTQSRDEGMRVSIQTKASETAKRSVRHFSVGSVESVVVSNPLAGSLVRRRMKEKGKERGGGFYEQRGHGGGSVESVGGVKRGGKETMVIVQHERSDHPLPPPPPAPTTPIPAITIHPATPETEINEPRFPHLTLSPPPKPPMATTDTASMASKMSLPRPSTTLIRTDEFRELYQTVVGGRASFDGMARRLSRGTL